MNKLHDAHMDRLFKAILTLENLDDCYAFFDDLCTITELKAMQQRFEVAEMLNDKHVYNDIAKSTGASTATISRVNRCLNYGSDGYRRVIERLGKKDE